MNRTHRSAVLALVVCAFVAPLSACSKADKSPPVATVSFKSSKTKVIATSPIEFTYRFDVAQDAKIEGDYRVFVHVVDADMKTLFFDDHDPEIPTSKWQLGQKIEYTRTRFVPAVPYLGEATVRMGLVKNNEDRLPLQGLDPADRESKDRDYKVGTLQLLPLTQAIYAYQKNGWHPPEFAADDTSKQWNWTQKSAVLGIRNPRQDVTFFLQYDARPDAFAKPQEVSVYLGNQLLDKFVAESTGLKLKRIPITAAQFGTNENAEIRVEVDRTFVPAQLPAGGQDLRELGIRIYHYYFEPK